MKATIMILISVLAIVCTSCSHSDDDIYGPNDLSATVTLHLDSSTASQSAAE